MGPPLQPPGVPIFLPGFPAGQGPSVFNSKIRDPLTFLLDRPRFRARRTGAFAVTEGVANFINWDTVDEDPYSGWSGGTPARWVAPCAGWYLVTGAVSISGTGAAGLIVIPECAVNAVSHTGIGSPGWEGQEAFVPVNAGTPKFVCSTWRVYCQVGDYIGLILFYSTESAITAVDTTAGQECRIEVVWDGV